MLLPAFLLVGCSKEISAEDAAKRVQEINEKRAAEPITEVKLAYSRKVTQGEDVQNGTGVFEIKGDVDFFHAKMEDSAYPTEAWGFKEGGKYYFARKSSAGKIYSEYTEEQKAQFVLAISGYKEEADAIIAGFTTVDLANLKEQFAKGCSEDWKYTSSGSGHLKVELKASGVVGEVSHDYEVSGEWKDYKPHEFIANDVTSAKKEEMSASFSYSVTVAHPDLAAESYVKI